MEIAKNSTYIVGWYVPSLLLSCTYSSYTQECKRTFIGNAKT